MTRVKAICITVDKNWKERFWESESYEFIEPKTQEQLYATLGVVVDQYTTVLSAQETDMFLVNSGTNTEPVWSVNPNVFRDSTGVACRVPVLGIKNAM